MSRRACAKLFCCLLLLSASLALLATTETPKKAQYWKPPDVYDPRPMDVIADSLEAHFARPVTYEDPVWVSANDAQFEGNDPRNGLIPKFRKLLLTGIPSLSNKAKLNQELIASILSAYAEQNGTPTFRVESSKYGFHIVSKASLNTAGLLQAQPSLMDAVINIPEVQFGSDPIDEICRAMTLVTGVRVWASQQLGAHRLFTGGRELPRKWKAENQTARSALISWLDKSATTFTWRLRCQPHEKAEKRFCVLGLSPLLVETKDVSGRPVKRILKYDRCKACPVGVPLPKE